MSGLLVFWLTSHLILSQPGGEAAKRIYMACDDHTDYMWSGDAQTYEQAFLRMLDYYLDLADQTENSPSAYQSRFVCDGYYWMVVYEQNRTRAEFETLISRVRDGHITVPLNPLCCCLGAAPAEAVLRSLYYPGRIERRYRLTFPLVISMENQTLSCGLASLWAGSGAKYCWKGICGCATKLPHAGDRQHDIYYYTGMDGQKILMKWNSLLTDNQGMGGYAEARDPRETIRYVDADPQFQSRYPFPIIGCFGKGWDDLETRTDEFPRIAREMTTPRRQIIVSNILDFFEDFEKHCAGRLPSETCTYGNEWELLLASLAIVSCLCITAATMATTLDTIVISSAGATMPVMSSPVPRARNISVTIPATIKAASAIAKHLTIFMKWVESRAIAHLIVLVAFSRIIPANVSTKIQTRKVTNPPGRPLGRVHGTGPRRFAPCSQRTARGAASDNNGAARDTSAGIALGLAYLP